MSIHFSQNTLSAAIHKKEAIYNWNSFFMLALIFQHKSSSKELRDIFCQNVSDCFYTISREDGKLLIICTKISKNWSLQRCGLLNGQAFIEAKIGNDISSWRVSCLGTQINSLIKRNVVKMCRIAFLIEGMEI